MSEVNHAPPTPGELAEWERLCDSATPEPWRADWRDTGHYELTGDGGRQWLSLPNSGFDRGEDLDFIAAARSAVPRLIAEVKRLSSAIRSHRDQRGDDRCWMDDEKLYAALPEGYTPPPRDSTVELRNCERYIASRHNPGTEYVSPEREIEQLKSENAKLRRELTDVFHRLSLIRQADGEPWPEFTWDGE